MIARIATALPLGFDGALVEVEADAKRGLPGLQIVGMGNKAIDEARERVRSAISNSYLDFPATKITINLAPAEIPKDGTSFDLPIALSILVVSGLLKETEVAGSLFAGELSLDGQLRPVRGIINVAEIAKMSGFKRLYIPKNNCAQASLVKGIDIFGIDNLKQLYLHLKGEARLKPHTHVAASLPRPPQHPTLDDISGQEHAKRALEIAAAGRHNILFYGSPGAGKTMLAKVLANLLPPLNEDEQVAVSKLYSLSGDNIDQIIYERPFRAPHHTASPVSVIGGGTKPKPGEISLAHMGVLFMDELPEYPRSVLEALRQPLEDKLISVARANGHFTYPADFMFIATMNPCPCGYFGDQNHECTCSQTQITAYQKRLSGPLLDRIDMQVAVTRIPHSALIESTSSMHNKQHSEVFKRINHLKYVQNERYNSSTIYNGNLSTSELRRRIVLSAEVKSIVETASKKLSLSPRAFYKIIKVSRTIADLEGSDAIQPDHMIEALHYRTQARDQYRA